MAQCEHGGRVGQVGDAEGKGSRGCRESQAVALSQETAVFVIQCRQTSHRQCETQERAS